MDRDAITTYYEAGREHARLNGDVPLEWTRTLDLLERHLPPAPAVVYMILAAAAVPTPSGWRNGATPSTCAI